MLKTFPGVILVCCSSRLKSQNSLIYHSQSQRSDYCKSAFLPRHTRLSFFSKIHLSKPTVAFLNAQLHNKLSKTYSLNFFIYNACRWLNGWMNGEVGFPANHKQFHFNMKEPLSQSYQWHTHKSSYAYTYPYKVSNRHTNAYTHIWHLVPEKAGQNSWTSCLIIMCTTGLKS